MPPAPLPPSVVAFLAGPHEAVMSTLRRDGSPYTAPTWYGLEADGRVLISTAAGRVRLRHLERDPRIALSVVDSGQPARHVSLMGRVTEMRPDTGLADMDRLAMRYTGAPYHRRYRDRVSAWMVVEAWHGWEPDLDAPWPAAAGEG